MCEIKALSSYKTSDELMMDLNNCFTRCPSVGTLLRSQADCPIYREALKRHLELLQKEDAERKKAVESVIAELGVPKRVEVKEPIGCKSS